MKNLVVAFEFDYTSRNAAKYAAGITKQSEMQLTLYHSFHALYPPADLPYMNDYISESQEDYSGRMEQYVDKLKRRYGLPSVKWMVRPGVLTDNLRGYTHEEDISMFVAGVNKKSLEEEAILGTTSFRLFKNTRIPVVAVPTKAKFTGIYKVLITFDFSRSGKKDFSTLLELQRSLGFEVIVLGLTSDRFRDEEVYAGKSFLQRTFADAPYKLIMKAGEDLPDLVERAVRTEKVDVLVVSAEDQYLLDAMSKKSLSRNLLNSLSRTTLLFLPEKEQGDSIFANMTDSFSSANNLLRHVS